MNQEQQHKLRYSANAFFTFVFFITLCLPTGSSLRAQSGSSRPAVEIPGSQLFRISSSVAGHEYVIDVLLPGNYADTTRVYPVIYHLDAQWDFPLVQAIYGQQYFDGFIPASIVVGITWGGPNPNYDSLRAIDLSPTFNARAPHSGNGPKFLSFIKNELIPAIDSRYRTDKKNRTLMGSSLGGLFTLYALFQESSLFNRYVLTSPAIGPNNQPIDSIEQDYAKYRANTPVRVFIAEGGLEPGVHAFEQYVGGLKSKHYPGLQLETMVLEGMGHSGGKAEGFTRGLQFVFRKPAVNLTDAVLDQYAGKYSVNPVFSVSIRREQGGLVVATPDGQTISLTAESDADFFVRVQFLKVQFRKDGAGKVAGFHLEQYGGESFFKKLD